MIKITKIIQQTSEEAHQSAKAANDMKIFSMKIKKTY